MIGRRKSEEGCSKGLSQRWKEDRISQLPDSLICQILSHLHTKEAVKTSVLSTRWTSLWLKVPSLELISRDFPDLSTFKSFGDRFLDSNRVLCIPNLKITFEDEDSKDASYLTSWVDAALTSWVDAAIKRKVQYLDVRCYQEHTTYEIPISLYTCGTLICLKLNDVDLVEAEFVISLPCLKTMDLVFNTYANDATFERLVSGCPVLDELVICGGGTQVFQVHSLSLKRLYIEEQRRNDAIYSSEYVIDAPRLGFLKIYDEDAESYIIKNLDSNAKLEISLSFRHVSDVSSKRNIIREFLSGISKAGEMIISLNTLKVFYHYSKLEPVPQFAYMSRLEAKIFLSDLKGLLTFLDCCPNLKSLVLALNNYYNEIDSEEMSQISFSTVPKCLVSSLKSVYIKSRIYGNVAEMKLLKYFLHNSRKLKKLTLGLHGCANKTVIFKKLLKIPRRSITSQVVVRKLRFVLECVDVHL